MIGSLLAKGAQDVGRVFCPPRIDKLTARSRGAFFEERGKVPLVLLIRLSVSARTRAALWTGRKIPSGP